MDPGGVSVSSVADRRGGPGTPADSPLTRQDVVASPDYQDLHTAKVAVGERAFPFVLPRLLASEGRTTESTERVALADYAGSQPVALIFGSYT